MIRLGICNELFETRERVEHTRQTKIGLHWRRAKTEGFHLTEIEGHSDY